MRKNISLENTNMYVLNSKVDEFINANCLNSIESKAHMCKVVLRHAVHHFPMNIPFIAAVKQCQEGVVLYNIKRSKMTVVQHIDVANMTNVGATFKVDGVVYEKVDEIAGFPRYKTNLKTKC